MKLAAVLLAAGASTRFGVVNKLLAPLGGKALIRHGADVLAAAGLDEIVAVTGADSAAITQVLAGLPIEVFANPQSGGGMGSSIAAGIAALRGDPDGVFIVPGDMPGITTQLLALLSQAFHTAGSNSAVYPVRGDGVQSPPVLWPRAALGDLAQLSGPQGGKQLLARFGGVAVAVDDERLLADIDTVADLARHGSGSAG